MLSATIRSKPEYREQVRELLLELVEPVRSEPGCLYYNLFQQSEDPAVFMLVAGWANDEAVAAH
ncbi:putative quinol monooxygenase [Chitinophaga sp. YR573]|uniref:putative quinol monooxygenase n=1 Tax=Chitinophaga sp. YR573 TaxID=1881040 RepID=UPI000B7FA37D